MLVNEYNNNCCCATLTCDFITALFGKLSTLSLKKEHVYIILIIILVYTILWHKFNCIYINITDISNSQKINVAIIYITVCVGCGMHKVLL